MFSLYEMCIKASKNTDVETFQIDDLLISTGEKHKKKKKTQMTYQEMSFSQLLLWNE